MPTLLSDQEIDEFLSDQGHGVLTFTSKDPYGIPISYGYTKEDAVPVLQLIFEEDSRKKSLLNENKTVSLVVYDYNDPFDWKSVIVEGELEEVDSLPDKYIEDFAADAAAVDFSIFDEDASDLDVRWYILNIENISGYQDPL